MHHARRLLATLSVVAVLGGAMPGGGAQASAGPVVRCTERAGGTVCVVGDRPAAGPDLSRPSIAELTALSNLDPDAGGLPAAPVAPSATAGIACDGNGVDGNRVQAVYAYRGSNDRYAKVAPLIRKYAAQVDTVFRASAARFDGYRRVRWVTNASCVLSVLKVKVTGNFERDIWGVEAQLAAKGLGRGDRHYLVWMDKRADWWCGLGDRPVDASKGPGNRANGGPYYGFVNAPCWGQSAPSGGESSEAHELMHTLGAVQAGSPHSTTGHCWDEWDTMCYYDGGHAMRKLCSSAGKNRFDCHGDDYYNPRPKAGSWLASHWNTAFSTYLVGVDKGPPVVGKPAWSADAYDPALAWTITEDQRVLRVVLEQRTDDGPWTAIADHERNAYRPGALAGGHTYAWRVRAMDSAGRWSAWTASDPVVVPANALPVVLMDPPQLSWYDPDLGAWSIAFAWASDDPDGWVEAEEVQLSDDGGTTWTPIDPWQAGEVTGVPGHAYRVRVRAQDDAGAWSAWVASAPIAIVADMVPVVRWLEVGQDWDGGWAWVSVDVVDEGEVTLEILVRDNGGAATPVVDDGFPVVPGHRYLVSARARDAAGQWSPTVTAELLAS